MKKLLCLGFTALMMLFAFGSAHADNAKVKVELSATSWTIGTTAPQFTVTITQATTTEPGGDEEVAPAAEGDALELGTDAGKIAVKVTLTKDGTTKEQVITQSPVDLTTTDLIAGTWALSYTVVKGESQTETFADVDVDAASANSLTVEAATVTETTAIPTFKVGEEAKESYELAADDGASVTVTIAAAGGADVYYTTDGTEPSTSTTTKGTSVTINTACTLKAIAQETGKNASAVASFVVTKATATTPDPQPAAAKDTVTVSLQNATWEMGKTTYPKINVAVKNAEGSALKLGNKAENVAVMAILSFTGVKPDTMILTSASKTLLATQLTKVGDWTLEYKLVRGNSTAKAPLDLHADTAAKLALVNTNAVKVTVEKGTLPKPTFSPKAGTVDAGTKVAISCSNNAAKIYYTTGTAEFSTTAWTEYTAPVEITAACKIKAIATHEDWNNSPIDSAEYTIAVLPADEEDAPVLTFTPNNTDSVDNNTEIIVTGIDTKVYIEVSYGVFSSVARAINARITDFEAYGGFMGSYPTITEEDTILVISLFDGENTINYYRAYKVRAASEVDMPQIVVPESETYNMFQLCSKGDRVQFMAEDVDAIYYTTDGSKPTIANGIKLEKAADGVAGGYYTLESSVVIRAIAVKDGKASDVAVARYNLVEDMHAALTLTADSLVGKGVPVGFSMAVEELGEAGASIPNMRPLTVYYTLDGETEPTQEAYEEWQEKDAANNPIKKVSAEVDEEWGYVITDGNGNTVSMILNEAGLVSFKGKGYLLLGDTKGLITTATLSKTLEVLVADKPEFNLVSGTEVKVGDSLIIKPTYPDTVETVLYFSFDGTTPSSTTYFSEENLEDYFVFKTDNNVPEIKVFFGRDEKGAYAYLPGVKEMYFDYDTVRCEDGFSIQVVQSVSLPTGKLNRFGMDETMEVASDVVTSSHMVMKDFPMPVITPNGGIVVKGEEVEISAGEGLEIYYTVDGSKPEKGATATKKYEGPVIVNEALTLKAIAFKAGVAGARDSVSNVAVAEFYLVPEMTVKTVGNMMKEDSIIFADGNVAFDMFIKEFAERDTIFRLHVTVRNTANEGDYPLADVFKAADSVRFVNTYYNGEYEAIFALMQPNLRGEYSATQDTTITFYVTENAEPVDPTLSVKAVDATMKEDTAVFISKAAFDMFAANYTENDTLFVTIYTTAEYEGVEDVAPRMKKVAADSVRFEVADLERGKYIAEFLMKHTDAKRGMTTTVCDTTIHFVIDTVSGPVDPGTAVEAGELAGVNVYPNPSNGTFNVAVPERAVIDIFGLNGAKVMGREVNAGVESFNIDRSGIYFVRVMAGNKTAVKRVVVR